VAAIYLTEDFRDYTMDGSYYRVGFVVVADLWAALVLLAFTPYTFR
jgi:hypothetical protein